MNSSSIPRVRLPVIIVIILTLAALALTFQVVLGQTAVASAVVNTGKLNLREGPSAGYAVLAALDIGTTVELLGRNPDASWVQVRAPGGLVGWTSSNFLMSSIIYNDLPLTSTAPVEPYGWIDTGRLNVRTGPGVAFPVVMTLTEGDVVSILGKSIDSNWVLIRAFGKTGWANAGNVGSSLAFGLLPRLDPITVTTSPAGGTTPTYGAAVTIPQVTHVLAAPGGATLISVGQGTPVLLAGRDASAGWVYVLLGNGTLGWVKAGEVGTSIFVTDLPVK